MMKQNNITEHSGRDQQDHLTKLIRTGVWMLIAQALEAEILD